MPTQTFKTFQKDKKILVNKREIRSFFNKLTIPKEDQWPVYKLHVYQNSYYIEELKNGKFTTQLGNYEPEGTLREMEKAVWDWVNSKQL